MLAHLGVRILSLPQSRQLSGSRSELRCQGSSGSGRQRDRGGLPGDFRPGLTTTRAAKANTASVPPRPITRPRISHRSPEVGLGNTVNIPTRPVLRSSRTSIATQNLQGAQGVYAFSGAQTAPPFLGTTTVGNGSASGIGGRRIRQLPAGRREFHHRQPAEGYAAPQNYAGFVFPGQLQGDIETDRRDGRALGSRSAWA